MSASELWDAFLRHFADSLKLFDDDRLRSVWHNLPGRTEFYTTELLRRVADRFQLDGLKLEVQKEWFTVDFAFWSTGSAIPIPTIFVESENNAKSAIHEVKKLCSLAAPLRVLITVADWEDVIPRWPKKGCRTEHTKNWLDIREAYTKAWPDAGVVGVLVGEWDPDDVLRFHALELPPTGIAFAGDRIVFEKKKLKAGS